VQKYSHQGGQTSQAHVPMDRSQCPPPPSPGGREGGREGRREGGRKTPSALLLQALEDVSWGEGVREREGGRGRKKG
jgi:hypothetical protein